MSNRIKINITEPIAYKAMLALEQYTQSTELTPIQRELIKIRASQINGCAYCINMHTQDARKAGETEQRIYALTAWPETPFFDEQEKALLALTEEVTIISGKVSDATYTKAVEVLGEKLVAQAIMSIIVINSWNRIAISTAMEPTL